jgi:hypothetical protein
MILQQPQLVSLFFPLTPNAASSMDHIVGLSNAVVSGVVHVIASFTAAILNHPSVQKAIGSSIVAGLKQLCHEDDLEEHLMAVSETLSKQSELHARQAGKDFPKIVGSFVQGMLSPQGKPKQKMNDEQKADKDKHTGQLKQFDEEGEYKEAKQEQDDVAIVSEDT